jgi:hypothetical protein
MDIQTLFAAHVWQVSIAKGYRVRDETDHKEMSR